MGLKQNIIRLVTLALLIIFTISTMIFLILKGIDETNKNNKPDEIDQWVSDYYNNPKYNDILLSQYLLLNYSYELLYLIYNPDWVDETFLESYGIDNVINIDEFTYYDSITIENTYAYSSEENWSDIPVIINGDISISHSIVNLNMILGRSDEENNINIDNSIVLIFDEWLPLNINQINIENSIVVFANPTDINANEYYFSNSLVVDLDESEDSKFSRGQAIGEHSYIDNLK